MSRIPWDLRVKRAGILAARSASCADMLSFYEGVLVKQSELYRQLASEDPAPQAADEFLTRAFRQPWAEVRYPEPAPGKWDITAVCPCCGEPPQLAVLREAQHGARRNLVCSLCSWEWEFRRILCPACAEDRFEKLPVFKTESYPAVRVEACETCSKYLLAVDMTVDATAVPLVDEVAAVTLHLWAQDQGLQHHHENLFGL